MFRAAPLFTAVAVAVRSRSRCYILPLRESTPEMREKQGYKRLAGGML